MKMVRPLVLPDLIPHGLEVIGSPLQLDVGFPLLGMGANVVSEMIYG